MPEPTETKLNARGLSAEAARLMVETALASETPANLRVVLTTSAAAEAVYALLEARGVQVSIDRMGGEYHIKARF